MPDKDKREDRVDKTHRYDKSEEKLVNSAAIVLLPSSYIILAATQMKNANMKLRNHSTTNVLQDFPTRTTLK